MPVNNRFTHQCHCRVRAIILNLIKVYFHTSRSGLAFFDFLIRCQTCQICVPEKDTIIFSFARNFAWDIPNDPRRMMMLLFRLTLTLICFKYVAVAKELVVPCSITQCNGGACVFENCPHSISCDGGACHFM